MRLRILFTLCVLAMFLAAPLEASAGDEAEQGTIVTLWPFFDYRESPGNGFSNLSILGPLIKVQQQGEERTTAVRPFVYRTVDKREQSATTSYLYPLASSREAPDVSTFQVL